MGWRHGGFGGPPRYGSKGLDRAQQLRPDRLEQLLGLPSVDQARIEERERRKALARAEYEANRDAALAQLNELEARRKWSTNVTVSLYKSTASGVPEVVVQTNAQTLDVFVTGLADALSSALANDSDAERTKLIAATLRNAFPVAFAIAGYKAEKVAETKLLTCGQAALDAAELIAQSRI